MLLRTCLADIEGASLTDLPDAFERLMTAGRTWFPPNLPSELG
jgi:hypothetical protein